MIGPQTQCGGGVWPRRLLPAAAICGLRFPIGNLQSSPLVLALLSFLPACSRSPTPGPIANSAPAPSGDLSPAALAVSPDGQNLYVACATGQTGAGLQHRSAPDHQTAGAAGRAFGAGVVARRHAAVCDLRGTRQPGLCHGHLFRQGAEDVGCRPHRPQPRLEPRRRRRSSSATASTTRSRCSTCARARRSPASRWRASLCPPP